MPSTPSRYLMFAQITYNLCWVTRCRGLRSTIIIIYIYIYIDLISRMKSQRSLERQQLTTISTSQWSYTLRRQMKERIYKQPQSLVLQRLLKRQIMYSSYRIEANLGYSISKRIGMMETLEEYPLHLIRNSNYSLNSQVTRLPISMKTK